MAGTTGFSGLAMAVLVAGALLAGLASRPASAHCPIPCGIYDDIARVDSMLEDVQTIRKAVVMITRLSGATDAQAQNQLVRWVMKKERRAQNIIDSISNYFLTQRVRASQEDYGERLQRHHAVIVAAMRAKETAEWSVVDELEAALLALSPYYPPHE